MCRARNQKIPWVVSLLASVGQFACGRGEAGPPVSPSVVVSLVGVEWSLVQLDDRPAGVGAGGVAPTLLLAAADTRASGFAGCNRLTATYELAADRLTLGQIATTRLFCAASMDLEGRYLTALEATRAYRVNGRDLELVGATGVVARFQTP